MVRLNWLGCACVIAILLVGVSQESTVKSQEPEGKSKVGIAPPARDAEDRGAIEGVLRAQQEAWNGGDVQAFMEHYWKSDELTFSSGGKTTRGWQATLDGYLKRYPTREKMGRLTLSGLEITPLSDAAAMVLGQWKLDGLGEPVSGNFTLVFRKIKNRWVIVHDHTSRSVE